MDLLDTVSQEILLLSRIAETRRGCDFRAKFIPVGPGKSPVAM